MGQVKKREELLKTIIEAIRSTLDEDKILNIICREVAMLYNIQRVTISVFADPAKCKKVIVKEEYKSSASIKGFADLENFFKVNTYWGANLLKTEEVVAFDNISKSNAPDFFKNSYNLLGVKSIIGVCIKKDKDIWGVLILSEYNRYRRWTNEDKELLKTLADQIYVAINQAELYSISKRNQEREALLRKTTQIIRSTLDEDKIKKEMVTAVAKTLQVDRCFIVEFDEKTQRFLSFRNEYLLSPEIESLAELNPEADTPEISAMARTKKEILYENSDDFLKENNIEDSLSADFLRKYKIMAGFALPILYRERFFGYLAYFYTKPMKFNEDDINFARILADQTGVALYQAQLYKKEKQTAEREELLRKTIQIIRSMLDEDKIKKEIVTAVAKTLQVDRCFIVEFDEKTQKFLSFKNEYLLSPEIESLAECNPEADTPEISAIARTKKEMLCENLNDFLKENNIEDSLSADFLREYKLIAGFSLPILYKERFFGYLAYFYTKPMKFNEDDINFARILADQTGVALYQVQLYKKEKQTAEREELLRKTIQIIRSTLDEDKIRQEIIAAVAKTLQADRCFTVEFDEKTQKFLPFKNEYLLSPEVESMKGVDPEVDLPEMVDFARTGKEISYKNLDDFLRENNIEDSVSAGILKKYKVMAGFSLPILYREHFFGHLSYFYSRPMKFNEDDINFAKVLADQTGVALYQVQLYKKEKQTAEREELLRKTIQIIRNTLDEDKIKKEIVTAVAKTLQVDRCFIVEFDEKTQKFLSFKNEYLLSPEIESLAELNPEVDTPEISAMARTKKEMLCENSDDFLKENNIEDSLSADFLRKYKLIAGFFLPILYKERFFGYLAYFYTKPMKFNDDDINFAKVLADQTGVALYQAQLYKKEKQTAEREKILRKTTQIIRSTLDPYEIKKYFVEITREYFDACRCLFAERDLETQTMLPFKIEKLKSPQLKSLINLNIKDSFPEFIERSKKGRDVLVRNVEKAYLREKLTGCKALETLHERGIKSGYGLSVRYGEQYYGTLIIHFTDKKKNLTHEEFNFLNALRNQTAIALYQAELYNTTQKTAENERTLREIILSSVSFDFKYIIKSIVTKTGKLFKSDRCFFVEYDIAPTERPYVKDYAEYRSSENIKTVTGKTFSKKAIKPFMEIMEKKEPAAVDNLEEIEMSEETRQVMKELNVKSYLVAPVYYEEMALGAIIIDYTKDFKRFSKNDINMARTIAGQSAVIMRQAELYSKVEEFSNKEKLLREIISNIKLSQRLEHIYNYLLFKFVDIFNVDRAFFIEIPDFDSDEMDIKYEFKKNPEDPSFKHELLPGVCRETFRKIIEDAGSYIVNDTKDFHPDSLAFQEFAKNHGVRSILSIPLIKYNEDKDILGIFVLCCRNAREWGKDESLLREILNSSVSVIWEIMKRNEIDELRNTFILTLAHDLQVPLVGERRALEFIMSIPPGQLLDKYKDIIAETIKNNINLSNFLTKLVDSYSYELGRKKLSLSEVSIYSLIAEAVESLKALAASKSIFIEVDPEENLPSILIDSDEIKKVINTLLTNAITYNSEGGKVKIRSNLIDNYIVICVIDNGFGISKEVQNRLFKRYEMALSIERKIGAGLGLYLSKQIIEAHDGRIWYETEVDKGTTFCFSLPVKDGNAIYEET